MVLQAPYGRSSLGRANYVMIALAINTHVSSCQRFLSIISYHGVQLFQRQAELHGGVQAKWSQVVRAGDMLDPRLLYLSRDAYETERVRILWDSGIHRL